MRDAEQAIDICKSMEYAARTPIVRAAVVRQTIDGAPPLDPGALKQMGASWKNNVNTQVLNGVVQLVVARTFMRLKTVKYLTAAKLPPSEFENAMAKTEKFRQVFTETVRNWLGWNVFLHGLCNEVLTYGVGFPTFMELWGWKPTCFRLDEAFVPQGTPVLSQDMQSFCVRHDFDVYELTAIIEREDAEESGWDIQSTKDAINAAGPQPRQITGQPFDSLRVQDVTREMIPPEGYQKAWNLVETYRLWTVETGNKLTERVVSRQSGKELFKNERPALKMRDVTLPMIFEYGNGKVYGSKGVGVKLYERAIMVERGRNAAQDNFFLRSKPMAVTPPGGDYTKVKLSVTAPITILSNANMVTSGTGVLADVTDAALRMDEFWERLLKEDVGAWMPLASDVAADKTATQARIDALMVNEANSYIMDALLTQVQMLTGMMSRRMFNPLATDASASIAQYKLLKAGLSVDEIRYLANQGPVENVVNFDQQIEQQRVAMLETKRGNPFYDQAVLEREIATIQFGSDFAAQVIQPIPDQVATGNNVRNQLLENDQLAKGVPMPVVVNDKDLDHMTVIQGQQDPTTGQWNNVITQAVAQGNLQGADNLLAHYSLHLDAGMQKKALGEAANTAKEFKREMEDLIMAAKKAIMEAQQAGMEGQLPMAAPGNLAA